MTDSVVLGGATAGPRRILRGPSALLGFIGFCIVLAGCGPSASLSSPTALPTGLDIPLDSLPADVQCYVAHGFRVVGVLPQAPGEPPGYKLESNMSNEEAAAVSAECDKLEPDAPEKTDAEIRTIYERWIDERTCLVRLGYTPDDPPSFETFLDDYRHGPSGPWMPIDGVDTGAWTDAEYQSAKAECTLEMFAR